MQAPGLLTPWIANTGPTGAGYDIVLLCHVACVVIGFGSLVASGVFGVRLLAVVRGGPVGPSLRRYYSPGPNLVGRTLYGVPVLGFALLAMSQGAYGADDGWVLAGLVTWAGVAFIAEGVVWPAERHVQRVLAAGTELTGLRRQALGLAVGPAACAVLLVVATVVMVAKP
jgi:hypothetical protein